MGLVCPESRVVTICNPPTLQAATFMLRALESAGLGQRWHSIYRILNATIFRVLTAENLFHCVTKFSATSSSSQPASTLNNPDTSNFRFEKSIVTCTFESTDDGSGLFCKPTGVYDSCEETSASRLKRFPVLHPIHDPQSYIPPFHTHQRACETPPRTLLFR